MESDWLFILVLLTLVLAGSACYNAREAHKHTHEIMEKLGMTEDRDGYSVLGGSDGMD